MISSTTSRVQFTANGVTTTFAFPYYFFTNSDLVVLKTDPTINTDQVMVLGTDYTITTSGSSPFTAGGNVVFNVAPLTTLIITIKRVIPIQQLVSYIANDSFPAQTQEQALDRLTIICQQLAENISRCIQVSSGDNTSLSLVIPHASVRASRILEFDVSGNVITL